MDRTHFLAAQATSQTGRARRDSRATASEIDAFYETHGHDVFQRLYRLRRGARSVLNGLAGGAARKRDFVAAPSSR